MRSNPKIVSLSPALQAAAGVTANGQPPADEGYWTLKLRSMTGLLRELDVPPDWLDDEHLAGKGAYARAWWLPNGRVLKYTFDVSDARAAALVAGAKAPVPGLVQVYGVWRMPGRASGYLILAEGTAEQPGEEQRAHAFLLLQLALERMSEWQCFDRVGGIKSLHAVVPQWTARLGNDPKEARVRERERAYADAMMGTILAGYDWLAARGVHAEDLHIENVRWSIQRDMPVIIDFGEPSVHERVRRVRGPQVPLAHNGSMERVRRSFDRHFDAAAREWPDLGTVELHLDEHAASDNGHGSERQFGYCKKGDPLVIAFAAKTEQLPQAYIDGLVAHEFGHAVEFRFGRAAVERRYGRLPESIERRADKIAEHVFGRSIEYGVNDVQCISCGGRPSRPRRLG